MNNIKLFESDMVSRILRMLQYEEMYVSQISDKVESPSTSVSNYIKFLRDNGLIERSKRTKAQYYKITDKGENFLEDKEKAQNQVEKVRRELKEKYVN